MDAAGRARSCEAGTFMYTYMNDSEMAWHAIEAIEQVQVLG